MTKAARIAVFFLSCAASAWAQELPLPEGPQTAAMPSAFGATQFARNQSRLFGTRLATQEPLFQWGPFSLSPDLEYQYSYGDGLQATPGQSSTTATQSVTTGFLLAAGSVWTLDYTPTWKFYSNPVFHDGLNQQAALAADTTYDDWTLQFSQSYGRSTDPLVETGRQTLDQNYSTSLGASYAGGSLLRLDLGLDQDMRFSPGSPDTYQWTSPEWLHYQVSPQVDTSIGPEFGYIIEVPGGDIAYVKPQAQVTWRATDKLDFNIQAGFEHEKFISSGGGDANLPTYSATVDYVPFEPTTLTAEATKGVQPSFSADVLTENTQFSLGLEQRLLRYFYLDVSAVDEKTNYTSTGGSQSNVRGDRTKSLQLGLRTTLFRRCSVALQYSKTLNASDVSGFGFSSYQYGFSIGYKY